MKIPEFNRSGIGIIVGLRGILSGFPNQEFGPPNFGIGLSGIFLITDDVIDVVI